ncbi:MAG: hypothetical protein K2M85_02055 [Paramuribaculum sp.]|nr:hypothetical protein [Paramuribaculum sp.]
MMQVVSIYGLLYDKDTKHKDDLWIWELNRYICYLMGCEKAQSNGCKLAPELFITEDGNMIALNVELKNLIYRIMKEKMTGYRIIETIEAFEPCPDEVQDIFVISQQLISRIQNKAH